MLKVSLVASDVIDVENSSVPIGEYSSVASFTLHVTLTKTPFGEIGSVISVKSEEGQNDMDVAIATTH